MEFVHDLVKNIHLDVVYQIHHILNLLRQKANGLLIGPYMSGLNRPAHIMVNSATPRAIFNVSALAAAEILSKGYST